MLIYRTAVAVLAVGAATWAVGAGEPAQAPKTFEGTYTIVKGEKMGKPVPPMHIEGSRVIITARSIVSTDRTGKRIYVADYTLDPGQKPARIDMKVAEGPDKGRPAKGLIAWEGRTVKLCYSVERGERPASLDPQAGGHEMCFTLQPVVALTGEQVG